jgi:hypothetical protein
MTEITETKDPQWRTVMLKRMHKTPVVGGESIPVTEPDTKKKKIEYKYSNRYDKTEYEITSATKQKSGDKYPKIIYKDKPRRATPKFTLEALTVVKSFVGPDGDLNIRTPSKEKARYMVRLAPGISSSAPESIKNFTNVEKQHDCLEWTRTLGRTALKHACNDEDVWPDLPKEENFVKNGNLAYMKSSEDDGMVIVLQSRLDDYDGNSNHPRFWRKTKEGEYIQEKMDSLTPGSLICVRASFRLWGGNFSNTPTPDCKWGVSGDLGRDILVLWRAPEYEDTYSSDSDGDEKESTCIDDVPYVEGW